MANLIADHKSATFPDFAERKQLAEDKTVFCIDSVKLFTQKDGKERWYLTIHYVDGDAVVTRTLTFDHSPSRDELFMFMQESNDFPQHFCWLNKKLLKNKQTFYDLAQGGVDGPCACTWSSTAEQPEWDDLPPAPDDDIPPPEEPLPDYFSDEFS